MEIFGDTTDYRSALCAYYMTLNIIELVECIASGNEEWVTQDGTRLEVPLNFLMMQDTVKVRGYHLMLNNLDQVRNIWRSRNVSDGKMKEHWKNWLMLVGKWLKKADFLGSPHTMPQKELFNDLGV